jgi:hypothetical protein
VPPVWPICAAFGVRAQRGDPLGPLYFCLTIKELMESMQSELILGYLDDETVGATPGPVWTTFSAWNMQPDVSAWR